jgi:serine/threonine-protein phosphatase 4 regulatory subunit 1
VRLNVIRNHVSFLSLLSPSKRSKYLPVLYEIIKSDAVLASQRTNALNPMVLNWRQRNMVTQILPNLLMLYGPAEIRQYLWPIIKILLCDSVNVVRENAEWSLPVMFRVYEEKNWKDGKGDVLPEAARLSSESCDEVIKYLKAILLDKRTTQKRSNNQSKNSGAFSNRQGYCRVLTAVAISLRLNGKEFRKRRKDSIPSSPFHDYTSDEYRHVNRVLKNHLLPLAMEMKDDRVTNVRLALAKCLRFLPTELREQDNVSTVLQTLEDEIDTWEGGGGLYLEGFMGGTSTSPSMKQKSIEQTESSDTVQSNQKLNEAKEKRRKEREDEDSKTLASI